VEYDFDRLTAPLLGHWAEGDDFANPNAAKIDATLKQRGKSCRARSPGRGYFFGAPFGTSAGMRSHAPFDTT
jgi:hypothetical protein